MKRLLLLAALLTGAHTATAQSASDVYGRWLTADENAHITITDCGDGTPCGEISWLNLEVAASDRDIRNPDKSLRDREIVGLRMVWGFKLRKERWRSGKVYDPETGRTYRGSLQPLEDNQLKLTGCFGPICRSQTWTRLPEN